MLLAGTSAVEYSSPTLHALMLQQMQQDCTCAARSCKRHLALMAKLPCPFAPLCRREPSALRHVAMLAAGGSVVLPLHCSPYNTQLVWCRLLVSDRGRHPTTELLHHPPSLPCMQTPHAPPCAILSPSTNTYVHLHSFSCNSPSAAAGGSRRRRRRCRFHVGACFLPKCT